VIRLALRVRRVDAERVLADLLELAPSGVEEVELPGGARGEDFIEYAVYGARGELPELPELRAAAGEALVEVSTSEVLDDWGERWRQFHRPVWIEAPAREDRIGGEATGAQAPALYVRPPWEPSTARAGAHEIVIDPAQAFGTGAHATTRLCLELLLALSAIEGARGPVLDVGAGSGVLAIAAAKLGYGPVVALDNDRESVRAVIANAAVNGVEVVARRFDLREEAWPPPLSEMGEDGDPTEHTASADSERAKPGRPPTVVLANLLRPLLLDLAERMTVSRSAGPVELIAGGLLCEQADEVTLAFARSLGLRERARRRRGEWSALWLTSSRSPRAPSP
jgi:ribosomal protein L11 methyltransferase